MSFLRTGSGRLRLGWRLLLFLFLTVLGATGFSLLVPGELPLASIPVLAGSVLAGWVLLGMEGRGPGALGFHRGPGVARESLLGLALGVTVAAGVVLGLVAAGVLRWVPDTGGFTDYVREGGRSLWLFTLPAAAEEALMRGYLLQALAGAWGGLQALLLTSGLFTLLHLGNPNTTWIGLTTILMAGLFLGAVYLKTASLWWATGAHLGWNWAHGFLADLPVSGLELVDTPLIEPRLRGSAWVSGGAFGPEGSAWAGIVLLFATVMVWKASWLRPGEGARDVRPLILSPGG